MELEGKIIDFLGDSITEGVGVEDIENCRYDNRLKKMLNLKAVYNHGVSGTRLAHQHHASEKPRHDLCFCGRAYDLNPDADVIIVYGGINDYIHGDASFGTMEDTTPETFCGGVEFLMNLLTELYPNAEKVFLTPAKHRYKDLDYKKPSNREGKLPDAKPLINYRNVIIEKAKAHNMFVVDLYNVLPFDAESSEDYEKYTADGLHFNDEGHKFLAEAVAVFLRKI